ncbi:hypothetical protein V5799_005505, partial [Amblyomma americanum]
MDEYKSCAREFYWFYGRTNWCFVTRGRVPSICVGTRRTTYEPCRLSSFPLVDDIPQTL